MHWNGPKLGPREHFQYKNPVIILLNHALFKINDLHLSNNVFWLAIDANRVFEVSACSIPRVKKIVSSHTVSGLRFVRKIMGSSDYYIPFSYDLHIGRKGFYTQPTRLCTSDALVPINPSANKNPHGSVMSMAIRLCITFQARSITLMGYDATSLGNKAYPQHTRLESDLPFSRKELDATDAALLRECQSQGIPIFNDSPLSESRIFEKSRPRERHAD